VRPPYRAFTLIELLIVVAIIAILAAIAVPNFLEAQTRSKISRAKADLRSLATGLESYFVDHNNYPYTESINASIWLPPGGFPRSVNARCAGITSPIAYLTSIPNDVFNHGVVDLNGVPTGEVAPLYYERAGFGILNGVLIRNRQSGVPSDAAPTRSLTGISTTNIGITDPRLTPAAYLLYSLGPDLSPHVKNASGSGFYTTSRWHLDNRYDPTNGTISPGNIIRLPGGVNFP